MPDLHFACNSVIERNTVKYLYDVFRVAGELGAELVILKSLQFAKENYQYDVYGIRVPTQETLSTFIEQVGKQAGLSDWHPITAEQYTPKEKPRTDQELADVYMGYMMSHVPHNEEVLATKMGANLEYIMPLEELNLASSSINVLKKYGILNIGDLLDFFDRAENYFAMIPELDEKFMDEVGQALEEAGYVAEEERELLEVLELTPRIHDALTQHSIGTVKQALRLLVLVGRYMLQNTEDFDQQSLDELRQKLIDKGYLPNPSDENASSSE